VVRTIGVGKADWFRPPLPPNRTGGFPASGSPVSGFTSMRIDESRSRRKQGCFSKLTMALGPDFHGKPINMHQRYRSQFEPSHVCLTQSVVLSRCRHSFYGLGLTTPPVASTSLRPFARRALPRFVARMDALTPGRPVLRILIRDNERRPCAHPGLLVSCIEPSDRSASNHLMSPPEFGLVSFPELTARSFHRIPFGDHVVTWASPSSSRLATTTGRIEFVILRTSRSTPVALHPLSRGRSYFRLQSSNPTLTRTFTLLI
jgi:hypothetical protein